MLYLISAILRARLQAQSLQLKRTYHLNITNGCLAQCAGFREAENLKNPYDVSASHLLHPYMLFKGLLPPTATQDNVYEHVDHLCAP